MILKPRSLLRLLGHRFPSFTRLPPSVSIQPPWSRPAMSKAADFRALTARDRGSRAELPPPLPLSTCRPALPRFAAAQSAALAALPRPLAPPLGTPRQAVDCCAARARSHHGVKCSLCPSSSTTP